MHYEGLFCRLKFDDSVFYYEANKRLSTAFFWNKSNNRVEVPVSAILDMKISSYLPFSKGLTFKIKSGIQYEKVKTLTPMNITAVPEHVLKALEELIEKNKQATQAVSA